MSHSCEKDQCDRCLWKPYHSCLTDKTQPQCEAHGPSHQWCGPSQAPGNSNGTRATINSTKARKQKTSRKSRAAYQATGNGTSGCGSCTGCWWTAVPPGQGCYPWNQATCDAQGSDYVWCGGNAPVNNNVFCCDSSVNPAVCQTLPPGSSCPTGTQSVASCATCTSSIKCPNPYYGGDGSSGCGISSILTNDAAGLAKWLKIFPALDPASPQYAAENCGGLGVGRDGMWNAGCLMFGQGGLNGLTAFLQAASQFTAFANGPDSRKNIIELASFLGNVAQETGDPPNGGLVYSAELLSCQTSLFGKGPIQLTGAVKYQMATLGLNKPSDYNNLVTQQGTLSGQCALDGLYPPADSCWDKCATAVPANPPQGSGYNLCAKPHLASGLNDLGSVPKLDPVPSWSSALWYWMNVPVSQSIAQTFYNIQADVSCATAHNLLQDPAYNCGDWCPVAAIAQVGCASCCVKPIATLDPMTVNRVGNFVKIAGILGLPEAQGSAANDLFCTLLNTCSQGAPNSKGTTCPANLSYDCYLNNSCGGGGGATPPICGNVKHSAPAPSCNVVPGNPVGATQAYCDPCRTGQQWWPCNIAGACEWASV